MFTLLFFFRISYGADHGAGVGRILARINLESPKRCREVGCNEYGSRQLQLALIDSTDDKVELQSLVAKDIYDGVYKIDNGMLAAVKDENGKIRAAVVPKVADPLTFETKLHFNEEKNVTNVYLHYVSTETTCDTTATLILDQSGRFEGFQHKICLRNGLSHNVEKHSCWVAIDQFGLFVAGDIKQLMSTSGRPNMDGCRCPWCDLLHSEWNKNHNAVGETWTLRKLEDMHLSKNTDKKGVTMSPLWKVCVKYYVIPTLHIQIGMVNQAWKGLCLWIDKNVELVSSEEQQLRIHFYSLEDKIEELKKKYDVEEASANAEKERLGKEISNLKKQVTFMKRKTRLIKISEDQRNEYLNEQKSLEEQVKQKTEQKEQALDALESSRKLIQEKVKEKKTTKDSIQILEKERKGDAAGMEVYLEDILHDDAKIYIRAFFGGYMNGVCCIRLLDHNEEVMNHVERKCLERIQIQHDIGSPCSEKEVKDEIGKFKEFFKSMDALIALLHQVWPTEEEIKMAYEAAKFVEEDWNALGLSIPIKAHVLTKHAPAQFEEFQGIQDLVEDYIERGHQIGKKLDYLTARMPQTFKTKQNYQIKQLHKNNLPPVLKKIQEVQDASKRNFKRDRKETKKEVSKKSRKGKRENHMVIKLEK